MNNKKARVIVPTSKTMCLKGNVKYKLIRTCVYCRVSTDNEDQKTSYDLQQLHYKIWLKKILTGNLQKFMLHSVIYMAREKTYLPFFAYFKTILKGGGTNIMFQFNDFIKVTKSDNLISLE